MKLAEMLVPVSISEHDTDTLLLAAKEYFYFINTENLHIVFEKMKRNEASIMKSEYGHLYLYFLYRYYLVINEMKKANATWERIEKRVAMNKEEQQVFDFVQGLKLIQDGKYEEAEKKFTFLSIEEQVSSYFYYEEILYHLALIKEKYFHKYEESIIFAKQALKYFNKRSNDYMSVCTMLILTRTYMILNMIGAAQEYISVLVDNKENDKITPDKLYVLYEHMAYLYEKKDDLPNALAFFKKAIAGGDVMDQQTYLQVYFSYCYFLHERMNQDCINEFKKLLKLSQASKNEIGEFLATYFILKIENKEKESIAYLHQKNYILENESIVPELLAKLKNEMKKVS